MSLMRFSQGYGSVRDSPPQQPAGRARTQRVALVQGASRGLGLALVSELLVQGEYSRIYATCRQPERASELAALAASHHALDIIPLDVSREVTIAAAAQQVQKAAGRVDLLINCAGVLHDGAGLQPEKRLADLKADAMTRAFQINALGALLLAREFEALLKRGTDARFVAISARVGSIGDNRRGGWYAYRASKAALNMLVRTLAIEWARPPRQVSCFALHPGTVETDLSQPFRRHLPEGQAVPADRAAKRLLETLHRLTPAQSGGFFAYDGTAIEW
jgi:NAD(P)-dependent dehydrogenase (short-subunit alcohol dehydrogenase family)